MGAFVPTSLPPGLTFYRRFTHYHLALSALKFTLTASSVHVLQDNLLLTNILLQGESKLHDSHG